MNHGLVLSLTLVILAGAAQAAPEGILNRFSVVGVISGSKDPRRPGVVVLADHQNAQKNVFIRVGQALPGYPRFALKSVQGKRVVISDGQEDIELRHDAAAASERMASSPQAPSNREQFGEPGFAHDELDDVEGDDYETGEVADEGLYPPRTGRLGNQVYPGRNANNPNNHNRGVAPVVPPPTSYLDELD